MRYKNISLVGTSHIAKQSLDRLQDEFELFKPDIVAVELDRRRLHALMTNQKPSVSIADIRRIGLKGFLFAAIGGYVQRKLGNIVGVSPGSDMKFAVELAGRTKAKVALIDQDIEITLRKLSKRITWKEKFRFLGDILKSLFNKKKALADMGIEDPKIDLTKVPEKELITKLLKAFEERYPNVYDVLVKERNRIMANNISRWVLHNPDDRLLVVIGAGHEEEMLHLIKQRLEGKVDIIR